MPELNFSISNRMGKAFGFVAQNALPRVADVGLGGKAFYRNLDIIQNPEAGGRPATLSIIPTERAIALSKMGTPVFDIITLSSPYLDAPYTFELLPMVDVSRQKRIVTTEVNGGGGEVSEYIGLEPWSIRFRGLLVDMDSHQFPLDQLKRLNELYEFADSLEVQSMLLQALGIYELYFVDFEPEFLEGYQDTIAYTLSARSHTPVDILLREA